jgi:hypothetical protein
MVEALALQRVVEVKMWWKFSRCENSARRAGGTNVVKLTPSKSVAPLHAALLLAARGVPPRGVQAEWQIFSTNLK